MQPGDKNEWRVETYDNPSHPELKYRVCRRGGHCRDDVWGYYPANEYKIAESAANYANANPNVVRWK